MNNPATNKIIPKLHIPMNVLDVVVFVNPIIEKMNPKAIVGFEKFGLILFLVIRKTAAEKVIDVIKY